LPRRDSDKHELESTFIVHLSYKVSSCAQIQQGIWKYLNLGA